MLRATLLCLLVAAAPAGAEDGAGDGEIEEGARLLSEGARRLLDGLMAEVGPGMRDLAEALRGLEDRLPEPPGGYHAPEILPNGDIIIRRRHPLAAPDGEIEL